MQTHMLTVAVEGGGAINIQNSMIFLEWATTPCKILREII